MKNTFFSLLAVVIAIAAAAFTTATKSSLPTGTKLFRYTAPGGSFSEANVENRANWVLVSGASICDEVNQRACEFLIDESHVNDDNTLKSTVTIQATQSAPNVFYVTGGTPTTPINKSN
jgi:hypothetical protein